MDYNELAFEVLLMEDGRLSVGEVILGALYHLPLREDVDLPRLRSAYDRVLQLFTDAGNTVHSRNRNPSDPNSYVLPGDPNYGVIAARIDFTLKTEHKDSPLLALLDCVEWLRPGPKAGTLEVRLAGYRWIYTQHSLIDRHRAATLEVVTSRFVFERRVHQHFSTNGSKPPEVLMNILTFQGGSVTLTTANEVLAAADVILDPPDEPREWMVSLLPHRATSDASLDESSVAVPERDAVAPRRWTGADEFVIVADLDAAPADLLLRLMGDLDALHRATGGAGLHIRGIETGTARAEAVLV